jgi:hypothetical protein
LRHVRLVERDAPDRQLPRRLPSCDLGVVDVDLDPARETLERVVLPVRRRRPPAPGAGAVLGVARARSSASRRALRANSKLINVCSRSCPVVGPTQSRSRSTISVDGPTAGARTAPAQIRT